MRQHFAVDDIAGLDLDLHVGDRAVQGYACGLGIPDQWRPTGRVGGQAGSNHIGEAIGAAISGTVNIRNNFV